MKEVLTMNNDKFNLCDKDGNLKDVPNYNITREGRCNNKIKDNIKDKVNEIVQKWVNYQGTIQGEIILICDLKVELRELPQTEYRDNKINWFTRMLHDLEQML
jgi:hypothetical protein